MTDQREAPAAAGDGGQELQGGGPTATEGNNIPSFAEEFAAVERSAREQAPIPATVDLDEAETFLNRLDGGGAFGFRVLRGVMAKNLYGTFAEVRDALVRENKAGASVYFTPNEFGDKLDEDGRVDPPPPGAPRRGSPACRAAT